VIEANSSSNSSNEGATRVSLPGRLGFSLLILTLAWAPFPLGSNRPWSWSLLAMLVALAWALWAASVWHAPLAPLRRYARDLRGPLTLGGLALVWGLVQIAPFVPESWSHPLWQVAGQVLGRHPAATISLNPWRTGTELMKLAAYAMTLWLARVYASRSERADLLLNALIAIGGCYAVYALAMAAFGMTQFSFFYSAPSDAKEIAAPFVNRNSFATYAGLTALAAGVRLVEKGTAVVIVRRSWRTLGLTLMQYLFGRGVP